MRTFLTFFVGALFGTGIAMSGMANPAKVINFFDIAGAWDPSLAFVMGGAVIVTFFGYRAVLRRQTPIYEPSFDVPANRTLDLRLILGAGIFGVGWGIAGFCPGGALPALGTLDSRVIIFVAALVAGMLGARLILDRHAARASRSQPAE